ncbi:MAG: hypothetical protein U0K87_14995 [Ruminococcus sp.]|nr:hypothetical protein [Ruminococcus sp.]
MLYKVSTDYILGLTDNAKPNQGNTAQFMAHALLAYYSVRLPKNQYPYVSMHTDYLYILTKNLTTQSAHQNYAVLP